MGDGQGMDEEEGSGRNEDAKVESLSNQVMSGVILKENWRRHSLGGKSPESNSVHSWVWRPIMTSK